MRIDGLWGKCCILIILQLREYNSGASEIDVNRAKMPRNCRESLMGGYAACGKVGHHEGGDTLACRQEDSQGLFICRTYTRPRPLLFDPRRRRDQAASEVV